ncbi:MAG TPA: hypothetical protein VJ691_00155 [Vicinamibacterales bacterium]|nr:hypothetical protein [Vicinamibacterales bacterium]
MTAIFLTLLLAQQTVSVEPIRCWRQSSAGAVVLGETFTVTLTCAVFETADTQVVPDESRLNVASIQMAPFEILGGSHPPDVTRGSRRFLQYDYQLRIISRDAIGQDVNVPPVTISYRVHSRVGAAAKLEGRDLSYLVPALPIRVLSLVPADASDIRDSGEASLATVQTLRTRSRTFRAVAYALGALAAAMVIFALVPLARRTRVGGERGRRLVPDRVLLNRAVASLGDTQTRAARDGWNDETLASALAAARVIAATAIRHPLSQKPLPGNGTAPEGRLIVESGFPRRTTATVSSAVTPDDVARAVAGRHEFSMTRAQQLEALRTALATLTAARYRRQPERDGAALDDSVRQVIDAARGER